MIDRIYHGNDGLLYAKTGEFRCPKKDEFWLDSVSCVCYAALDFTVAYPIVREVEIDVPATYKFKE